MLAVLICSIFGLLQCESIALHQSKTKQGGSEASQMMHRLVRVANGFQSGSSWNNARPVTDQFQRLGLFNLASMQTKNQNATISLPYLKTGVKNNQLQLPV
jgi:hypothetical protein